MTILSDEELAAALTEVRSDLSLVMAAGRYAAFDFIQRIEAHIEALTTQRDQAIKERDYAWGERDHAWAVRDRVTAFAGRNVKTYRAEQDTLTAQRDAARAMVVALTSGPGDEQEIPDEDRLPIAERTLDALLGRS